MWIKNECEKWQNYVGWRCKTLWWGLLQSSTHRTTAETSQLFVLLAEEIQNGVWVFFFSIPKLTSYVCLIQIVGLPWWTTVSVGTRGKSALCHFHLWSLHVSDQICLRAVRVVPCSISTPAVFAELHSYPSPATQVQSVPTDKDWGIPVGCPQATSVGTG